MNKPLSNEQTITKIVNEILPHKEWCEIKQTRFKSKSCTCGMQTRQDEAMPLITRYGLEQRKDERHILQGSVDRAIEQGGEAVRLKAITRINDERITEITNELQALTNQEGKTE